MRHGCRESRVVRQIATQENELLCDTEFDRITTICNNDGVSWCGEHNSRPGWSGSWRATIRQRARRIIEAPGTMASLPVPREKRLVAKTDIAVWMDRDGADQQWRRKPSVPRTSPAAGRTLKLNQTTLGKYINEGKRLRADSQGIQQRCRWGISCDDRGSTSCKQLSKASREASYHGAHCETPSPPPGLVRWVQPGAFTPVAGLRTADASRRVQCLPRGLVPWTAWVKVNAHREASSHGRVREHASRRASCGGPSNDAATPAMGPRSTAKVQLRPLFWCGSQQSTTPPEWSE